MPEGEYGELPIDDEDDGPDEWRGDCDDPSREDEDAE
jgi:hypothetical protein